MRLADECQVPVDAVELDALRFDSAQRRLAHVGIRHRQVRHDLASALTEAFGEDAQDMRGPLDPSLHLGKLVDPDAGLRKCYPIAVPAPLVLPFSGSHPASSPQSKCPVPYIAQEWRSHYMMSRLDGRLGRLPNSHLAER